MWIQRDGAPTHSVISVQNYLHQMYPNWWMGHYGLFPWPASTPVIIEIDLIACIAATALVIQIYEAWSRKCEVMAKRCNSYIRANRANFEHVL
ncbi:hypothetical protein PR048_011188 [Dryococelus australis]|uniref:Uncharacterized protein n=1 Tax=Dryococelus australis TaxID=614101 RepID=A0ABQ9HL72_9NEOP|nr:hypothetical protein PR048_011188 [Dryococelus australis]